MANFIRIKKKSVEGSTSKEQPDYYKENGLLVFTEKYHQKRGYCCESGCRHCPYGFEKDKSKGSPDGNNSF